MTLSFSVDNSVLNLAVGKVFEAAADKMVDAFCSRVDALHG
jgi:ribosome-associated toxin RatA of RatAB toxin-antitoxin module